MDIQKAIESGIAKMAEFEFSGDTVPYLTVGYGHATNSCYICGNDIWHGERCIEWTTALRGKNERLQSHIDCFLGALFWNIAKLEDSYGNGLGAEKAGL